MESISWSSSPIYLNPLSLRFNSTTTPSILSFPYSYTYTSSPQHRSSSSASKTTISDDLFRKPTKDHHGVFSKGVSEFEDEEEKTSETEKWVDWEDQIQEAISPLVGFVKMVLHSGKYKSGERLSSYHENIVIHRLLAHHPEMEKKVGCGINYIMVGQHPDFERSRCLFVVRKNGDMVDFSYWKCIKEFIRKKYPLYADSFIRHTLKHGD